MLLYHFARGRLTSTDLDEGPLPTLNEGTVDVFLAPNRFGQAGVSQADILACNAVYVLSSGYWVPHTPPRSSQKPFLRPAST
jgi:hypothetical protein